MEYLNLIHDFAHQQQMEAGTIGRRGRMIHTAVDAHTNVYYVLSSLVTGRAPVECWKDCLMWCTVSHFSCGVVWLSSTKTCWLPTSPTGLQLRLMWKEWMGLLHRALIMGWTSQVPLTEEAARHSPSDAASVDSHRGLGILFWTSSGNV